MSDGFRGSAPDLEQFLALVASPIRSPEREAALLAWEAYKLGRQRSDLIERRRAEGRSTVLGKGSTMHALTLRTVDLSGAELPDVVVGYADLRGVVFDDVRFTHERLAWGSLKGARLQRASMVRADLRGMRLMQADLRSADLRFALLSGVDLTGANLAGADLSGADLSGADLSHANLVDADLRGTNLSGARVFGVAAWNTLMDDDTSGLHKGLVITREGEAEVTVDDLRVAQFVHLLLTNRSIRTVIDTVGEKAVLLLGRFGDRMGVLDRLREGLRDLGFVPLVFDFEKPASRDFTETVRTLVGLSAFVIADVTRPRSVPQEAQAVIPDYMVPFVPIVEAGEEPWSMFEDLWRRHAAWVLDPLEYDSVDRLVANLDAAVVQPAMACRARLLAERTRTMPIRHLP